jgi:hypothetical protein
MTVVVYPSNSPPVGSAVSLTANGSEPQAPGLGGGTLQLGQLENFLFLIRAEPHARAPCPKARTVGSKVHPGEAGAKRPRDRVGRS